MAGPRTSTRYDALVQRIGRMADGISRHKGEKGFPAWLDDADLLAKRQQLEVTREHYELLTAQARQAYEAFDAMLQSLAAEMAQDDNAVHGFYGKHSAVVAEFGAKVLASRAGRKVNRKPKAQLEPAK